MRRWTIGAALLALVAAGAQTVPADAPLGSPGLCPFGGPAGGGGPVWQSEAQAALRQRVREANWELYRLMNVQPADPAAIAAQQAVVNQLRQELWAQRDAERQQMWQSRQTTGYGAGQGFGAGGRGYGRGQRGGWGYGRGQRAGYGACPYLPAG